MPDHLGRGRIRIDVVGHAVVADLALQVVRAAVQVGKTVGADVVECNPRFGPKAFDTAVAYANGETIPATIINPDQMYTPENAKDLLDTAY